MTRDEYIKIRLLLAQRFASADKGQYIDATPPEVRATIPGWRPHGKMDAALHDADELLRAADVQEPKE